MRDGSARKRRTERCCDVMQTISIRTGHPYEVLVGRSILPECGAAVAKVVAPCAAAIVTDDTVDALYGASIEASLRRAGFSVSRIVFPHGEASKNLQTLAQVLESLAQAGLTRSDLIVALGGGVVGDLAGFAAAVYLRGIRFVQIPTTLLAMIDSSVGGKTAVDLEAGKNLAGAFWQPELVLCDTALLSTLPLNYRLDGLGEMIKYGMGFDASLLSMLRSGEWERDPEALVARCVAIKEAVVSADERDNAVRQKLNLGHTAAHAIERCSGFSITHGRAVATGTALVTRACVRRGELPAEALALLEETLDRCGLEKRCHFSAAALAQAAMHDKKRRGNRITLILPDAVGSCRLSPIAVEELESFFADGL